MERTARQGSGQGCKERSSEPHVKVQLDQCVLQLQLAALQQFLSRLPRAVGWSVDRFWPQTLLPF